MVNTKNIILNTTLDLRAGMDTLKIHLPEKYLRDESNKLLVKVKDILNGDQFFVNEIREATNPIEITIDKSLVTYTGDVYVEFSTLPDFKFYFTVKNESSTVYPEKTSKSFYPSDTVFINKIPVVELTEINVDEILENNKATAKAVINKEEIGKTLFAGPNGNYTNIENVIEGHVDGTGSHNGTLETSIENFALKGILSHDPDGMWTRWLSSAFMTGSSCRYKSDNSPSPRPVSLSDVVSTWLINGETSRPEENPIGNMIREHNLLVKENKELKRVVKQLATSAGIENTIRVD